MLKEKFKEYKKLTLIEKKIAARKHSAMNTKSKYSFPIMIILIVISYYIYEYVNNYILPVIILIAIIFYIIHEIKLRRWFNKNRIILTKKDFILYGTDYEIEKGCKNVKEKIRKIKR